MWADADVLWAARALWSEGRTEEAVVLLLQAVDRNPTSSAILEAAASALLRLSRGEQARLLVDRACRLNPTSVDFQVLAAKLNDLRGEFDTALSHMRSAAELAPASIEIRNRLCRALFKIGRDDEGRELGERAWVEQPDNVDALCLCACVRGYQSGAESQLQTIRVGLEKWPEDIRLLTLASFTMLYVNGDDPAALLVQHRKLGQVMARLMPPDPTPLSNSPDPDRPLRVGYVSQDFRNRSAAHFIEALLVHHDRDRFQVHCYHHVLEEDEMTARLRGEVYAWRNIDQMSDHAVAQQVRADGIDILVDLSGHSVRGRLWPFCLRPAPIQVTYLGYPCTTGLPTMDHRIVDQVTDPSGAERFSTESLLRLNGCFLCYKGPPNAPHVSVPAGNRRVTFGSFNYHDKVQPQTVCLWAQVLRAVPEARMVLKFEFEYQSAAKNLIRSWFTDQGIHADRIEIRGRTPTTHEHLASYADIDIALDTLPYNGTTTTMEALWMGVPVVTLEGTAHVSRVGASLLRHGGFGDWVGRTPAELVAVACRLAQDVKALRDLRPHLRERVRSSPLCDGPAHVRRLEDAYRSIWRDWCARGPTRQAGSS
jgi:predicted O-linked N-acetylglucosamine transferase (SPINDLY family)